MHITIAVTTDMTGDQRVHRTAKALSEEGHEVQVFCRKKPDSPQLEKRPYEIRRIKMLFNRGKLFYAFFNLRLFFHLLFTRSDFFYANDLDTLLAVFIAAKIRRKPLLYDAHELFTEVPELVNRPGVRRIWMSIEKRILPRLQRMVTVSEGLVREYESRYPEIKAQLVRNLPERKEMNAPEKPGNILIYQGALNKGRGIELMIETMELLPEFELWLAGTGSRESEIRKQGEGKVYVRFLGQIPLDELHEITQKASLGFSLEEDIGKNYRFALPNKIFDYIQAGIPVICSDLPEMKQLVSDYSLGIVLKREERSPEKLAGLVRELMQQEKYLQFASSARNAASELCWDNEKHNLLKLISGSDRDL